MHLYLVKITYCLRGQTAFDFPTLDRRRTDALTPGLARPGRLSMPIRPLPSLAHQTPHQEADAPAAAGGNRI